MNRTHFNTPVPQPPPCSFCRFAAAQPNGSTSEDYLQEGALAVLAMASRVPLNIFEDPNLPIHGVQRFIFQLENTEFKGAPNSRIAERERQDSWGLELAPSPSRDLLVLTLLTLPPQWRTFSQFRLKSQSMSSDGYRGHVFPNRCTSRKPKHNSSMNGGAMSMRTYFRMQQRGSKHLKPQW